MRLLLAQVALVLTAFSATAQVPFGRDYVLDTRFGNLQIVGGPDTAFVFYEGLFYEQLPGHNFAIIAAAGTANTDVDWVLLERLFHNAECRTMHILLAVTPEGLSYSWPFGACNGVPTDMQVFEGQVQVSIAGTGDVETFTFDGNELHQGDAASAPPPPDEIRPRRAQSSSATTRYGRFWVQDQGEWEQVLMQDGQPTTLGPSEAYWIRGVYEGDGHDWMIVSSNHSGNMCGGYGQWFVIRTGPDGTAVAPPLDACRALLDVRVLPEEGGLEIDLSHGDLGIAQETFFWDGVTLTSILVPESPAEPAGAGEEVTRWVGRSTYEVFQDASERARMGTVMSPDQIQNLAAAMSFGGQIEQRGDWVIAGSCQQHNCGQSRGVWAVRISDGAVAAALLWGTPSTVTGFGPIDDPVVAAFIEEHAS